MDQSFVTPLLIKVIRDDFTLFFYGRRDKKVRIKSGLLINNLARCVGKNMVPDRRLCLFLKEVL
jgi:hypothetical protein